MNIEAQTINKTTKMNEKAATGKNVANKDGDSFKDALVSVSGNDSAQASIVNAQDKTANAQATEKNADAKTETKESAGKNQAKKATIEQNQGQGDEQNSEQINAQIALNVQQSQIIPTQENTTKTNGSNKGTATTSTEKKVSTTISEQNKLGPIEELKNQIENITNLKHNDKSNSKTINGFAQVNENIKNNNLDKNAIKITKEDAQFFIDLTKNQQFTINNSGDIQQISAESKTESSQAPIQISATIAGALQESMKTNKPFRMDFDNNVAVIIKVDKQGKLSAEFIPGDAAVENYLRNNIPSLQQTFNEQKLPYNELSYRKHKQEQNNNNNSKNKEKDDE